MQSREDMHLRLDCSVCVQSCMKLYKADATKSKRWHQSSAACTCMWKKSPICIAGCDSSWQSKLSAAATWQSNLEQWHQPQDFSSNIWLGQEVLPSFWSASFFFSPQIVFRNEYAAAAKSLQSCPTLCNPLDGSPPGSPVPGILQARTLEWVAISFSNAWKWKVKVKLLCRVRLLATPWTAAYQASPSIGFSRQEY